MFIDDFSMDAVKLEAKWPPDRKSTIGASEFGIYKEPTDGKRLRSTDRATGCLLVLSLMAAAAVVLYFFFYDYTIPTTQAASTSLIVSYAKYVKEKNTLTTQTVDRSTNGLPDAVLGVQMADTTSVPAGDEVVIAKRVDDGRSGNGRHMRLYPTAPQRPAYLSYDSSYWRNNLNKNHKLEYSDGIYGADRRSDFPQLAAYHAPFPPKSILDVMKYVTGAPPHRVEVPEYMIAQESNPQYYPIRPAEEVNRFLPDVNTPGTNLRRFRNKFGPPVFLTPPIMSLPDDFMKPPNPDARFSMDFDSDDVPVVDLTLQEGSASVPSHTGVIFRPPVNGGYPVPDYPKPKKVKNRRNKKPISVMLDIYPLPDNEHENEEAGGDEEEHHSELITSYKNNGQYSDSDKLMFRLNLFPKFSEGGRRTSKSLKYEEQENLEPIIHSTSDKPLQDKKHEINVEDEKLFDYEYTSKSKNMANISKT